MGLLRGKDFDAQFTGFDHTAWRLETREVYNVEEEAEDFARFLAGEPPRIDDYSRAWYDMIQAAVAAGKRFARVRVVPNPLTDYLRFEAEACQLNVAAGEDIRYLDAGRARELGLPRNVDFWLFDSIRIAQLHFDEDNRPLGAEIIRDPVRVVEANRLRDVAWHYAIPFHTWWAAQKGANEQRRERP
ncbi:MAG: hypothetical protein L0Y54_00915 [Sporichthyaceae bacterium]|nr:hypothetical protein [Sporichthyaceae bacterium]